MAELVIVPESPSPGEGIMFSVEGEMPDGRIVVFKNGETEEQTASPVFGQENVFRNAEFTVELTGDPTGGVFALTINGTEVADIPWDADQDDLTELIEDELGEGVVRVSDGILPDDILTLEFVGDLAGQDISMSGADTLTGGSSPGVTVTETVAGGKTGQGGPMNWGPIFLPEGVYNVDLLYASGDDEGESMLEDMIDLYVE